MRLVITGGEENCKAFDKAIKENKNIGVLLKSKEEENTVYIIDHKNWKYDNKISAILMQGRIILTPAGLERKIDIIHSSYFEVFKDQDIMTQELFDSLSIVHTNINQSIEKHETTMVVREDMIKDVIENIQKYDLCEIKEIGLFNDEFFLRIYNENITDYKSIDILMDDNYSVLFEKKITFIYGKEWMSYSNLFFCSKFKIKLLTLNEFRKREFDKQMDAETGNTIPVNFNAKNILTKEAVIKAGYEKSKHNELTYTKIVDYPDKSYEIKISFDSSFIVATIKFYGMSYRSTRLSDEQLTELLETGIITEFI